MTGRALLCSTLLLAVVACEQPKPAAAAPDDEPAPTAPAAPSAEPASADAAATDDGDLAPSEGEPRVWGIMVQEPSHFCDSEYAKEHAKDFAECERNRGPSGMKIGLPESRTLDVHGPLNRGLVVRIARAHSSELRECYAKGLARRPDLAGELIIDFTVAASGKVERAIARDGFADDEVASCIANEFRRWTFPKPTGGIDVEIRFPLTLTTT